MRPVLGRLEITNSGHPVAQDSAVHIKALSIASTRDPSASRHATGRRLGRGPVVPQCSAVKGCHPEAAVLPTVRVLSRRQDFGATANEAARQQGSRARDDVSDRHFAIRNPKSTIRNRDSLVAAAGRDAGGHADGRVALAPMPRRTAVGMPPDTVQGSKTSCTRRGARSTFAVVWGGCYKTGGDVGGCKCGGSR